MTWLKKFEQTKFVPQTKNILTGKLRGQSFSYQLKYLKVIYKKVFIILTVTDNINNRIIIDKSIFL